ncbi:MAG: universal stress protein UspA [Alphaproteobacteria bacterium RIFCSPHIGHO2_12_FULL_66_14]|jgi:nucleotide-binding universal stress UspA family protein|nr:MAG: universal stress protein UspA [Alphaproteobacteria bacterium RIFCSPHIGHO2_12_FULL_66_14]
MTTIVACVDGSIYSHSVADHAAWAAKRLPAAVELLQVLGRREASSADLSGNITVDMQQSLLAELATLDAQRAKLLQKRGRMVLEEAKARLLQAGVAGVTVSLRNGDLLETLAEREATADLVVIGKRGEAADFARLHLGSNIERVVRSLSRPILVASRAFRPIAKVLIAFDGGPSALKAVDHVSRSPMFAGLAVSLVMAGRDEPAARQRIDAAAAQLRGGGLAVEATIEPGPSDKAIAAVVERAGIDLLVMGAYGHSRVRSLIIGSTTTEMIRACKVPVLLFR